VERRVEWSGDSSGSSCPDAGDRCPTCCMRRSNEEAPPAPPECGAFVAPVDCVVTELDSFCTEPTHRFYSSDDDIVHRVPQERPSSPSRLAAHPMLPSATPPPLPPPAAPSARAGAARAGASAAAAGTSELAAAWWRVGASAQGQVDLQRRGGGSVASLRSGHDRRGQRASHPTWQPLRDLLPRSARAPPPPRPHDDDVMTHATCHG
jgi:hypothetical protein